MATSQETKEMCQYHLTILAEQEGTQFVKCANVGTRGIAGPGPSASGLVILSILEDHYQRMQKYIGQDSAQEELDDDEQEEETGEEEEK